MVVTRSEWRTFTRFINEPNSVDIISLTEKFDMSNSQAPDYIAKAITILERNPINHKVFNQAILFWANRSKFSMDYYRIKALAALLMANANSRYPLLKTFHDEEGE